MAEQFSEQFYIEVWQQLGDKTASLSIQRLACRDNSAELTEHDLVQADFRATMQGDFEPGYYEVELRRLGNDEVIDSQACVL